MHIHKRSKVLRGFVSTLSRELRSGERFLFYIHACLEVVGTFTSAHQLFFWEIYKSTHFLRCATVFQSQSTKSIQGHQSWPSSGAMQVAQWWQSVNARVSAKLCFKRVTHSHTMTMTLSITCIIGWFKIWWVLQNPAIGAQCWWSIMPSTRKGGKRGRAEVDDHSDILSERLLCKLLAEPLPPNASWSRVWSFMVCVL